MQAMTEIPGPDTPAEVAEAAPAIRASDAERQAVATQLNEAVAAGRLTLEEFSQRLDGAYSAKTRGQLDELVADLPGARPAAAATGPAAAPAKPQWSMSLIGGTRRRGRWLVPARLGHLAVIGGLNLDLREAQLSGTEAQIDAYSVIGGVSVTVPRGVRVLVEGYTLLGGRRIQVDETAVGPGAPTVRIRLFSLIGGVDVRNR